MRPIYSLARVVSVTGGRARPHCAEAPPASVVSHVLCQKEMLFSSVYGAKTWATVPEASERAVRACVNFIVANVRSHQEICVLSTRE